MWHVLAPPGICHSRGPRAGIRRGGMGRFAQVREDVVHGHGLGDEKAMMHTARVLPAECAPKEALLEGTCSEIP